ncbi:MAG: energy transducer TonB [Ignavibacteriaceae bacterium]|nr:energy transducer TonB [Ignavibacteriaceae bacterium]
MRYRPVKNFSFSVSIVFHLLLFASLLYYKVTTTHEPEQLYEISFGTGEGTGSSGGSGTQINPAYAPPQDIQKPVDNSKNIKGVDLSKSTAKENNEVTEPIGRKKNTTQKNVESDNLASGIGNGGEGPGGFGYGIDWGGKGTRKIYSYVLPAYPPGVDKEINIKLRFSILPDGTVGNIIPLTKADTRLEDAAINSLRQWRFEASPGKLEQVAVIVFPYRLQ